MTDTPADGVGNQTDLLEFGLRPPISRLFAVRACGECHAVLTQTIREYQWTAQCYHCGARGAKLIA